MTWLLRNGTVVNVFTGALERADVLIGDDRILGVGDYSSASADAVRDISGKFLCPGLIDGHIHIESSMLSPYELARVCVPHGTTALVTDPHEIANVCGTKGIEYMLAASEGLPLQVFVMLPSCVPATTLDESGAVLRAEDLYPFYRHPRVLGLAEMMNVPGVLSGDKDVMHKIEDARSLNRPIDGHAPMLTGCDLDAYIAAGITTDHECSSYEEGLERISKGQWLMIREGSAARNLDALLPFFDQPYARRCLLVTDDKHPADLLESGHIDGIIRKAVSKGKSAVTGIQMATVQAAQCFGLKDMGAVAPGYRADLVILDDLDSMAVSAVYCSGKPTVQNGELLNISRPSVPRALENDVHNTVHMRDLSPEDFMLSPQPGKCRVIGVSPGSLITREELSELPWSKTNGIDLSRDILKLAVVERHHRTGHIGLGFVRGLGLKSGAIASSVSHDSHNLIIAGADERDMALAANRIKTLGGGYAVAADGKILCELALPVAGLMSEQTAEEAAGQNALLLRTVRSLGVPENISPFMLLSFIALAVIPSLKMTTRGLVDVNRMALVDLFL